METLRVATEELHATASGWGAMAAELTATAPPVPAVSSQPSAAAVSAVHADVAAAGAVLTARTQITAVKTTAAATAFADGEATSADLLNALTDSL